MTRKLSQQQNEIGMVGLGLMERNFVLNLADEGISVTGYNRVSSTVAAPRQKAKQGDARCAVDIKESIVLLRRPRAVMLPVPAGSPVDSVINALLAHLPSGDPIIDAGNSHFKDTEVRYRNLAPRGIQLLGVGVSAGGEGARCGPSIMPDGTKGAYERVRPIFEAAAAQINGEPCTANPIQAQRDHFGSHTYERLDAKGTFHAVWENTQDL